MLSDLACLCCKHPEQIRNYRDSVRSGYSLSDAESVRTEWVNVAAQLAIIGYVSWMQPTTAIAGVLVLVLASLLRNLNEALTIRDRESLWEEWPHARRSARPERR